MFEVYIPAVTVNKNAQQMHISVIRTYNILLQAVFAGHRRVNFIDCLQNHIHIDDFPAKTAYSRISCVRITEMCICWAFLLTVSACIYTSNMYISIPTAIFSKNTE